MMEIPDKFLTRQDESADEDFYLEPRLVTHIDDATINALTDYYREALAPEHRLLDLMSSWISHLPADQRYQHISGLGMNTVELANNPRLDDFVVHNLNDKPIIPYESASFNAVTIAVSVQYLKRPLEVFSEIARILVPGGKCIVAMSHRLFPTKAVYAFHVLPKDERCQLVASYMNQTEQFASIEVVDRSPVGADPLWIVVGEKSLSTKHEA